MARFFTFESAEIFPVVVSDLEPVAQEVMRYFESQRYEVLGQQTAGGGWFVSVHRGKLFKTVLGTQTALNVVLEPTNTNTIARAGVGVFGRQDVPMEVSSYILWPVVLTQIRDLVRQHNLDEEALSAVEQALISYSRTAPATGAPDTDRPAADEAPTTGPLAAEPAATFYPSAGAERTSGPQEEPQVQHCTNCGMALAPGTRFCTSCGTPVAS